MLIKKETIKTIKSKDIIWRKFIGYLMKTLIRYFHICNQSCNQFKIDKYFLRNVKS